MSCNRPLSVVNSCRRLNAINKTWTIIKGVRHLSSNPHWNRQGQSELKNKLVIPVQSFSASARNHAFDNPEREQDAQNSTIDEAEVKKFSRLAQAWWDEQGEFAALHTLNELRIPLVRDALLQQRVPLDGAPPPRTAKPLTGFKVADIGCGGGLLSEPLARLGAEVTGIDASGENVETARWHADLDPAIKDNLEYIASGVEDLTTSHTERFDGLIASEIVEHVTNQEHFVETCCALVKPGGSIFFTTINKNALSYALAVVAAEQVFRIVPAGAHDWNKFLPPEKLQHMLTHNGCHTVLMHGMTMNPFSLRWCWIPNTTINYAVHAVKQGPRREEDEAGV